MTPFKNLVRVDLEDSPHKTPRKEHNTCECAWKKFERTKSPTRNASFLLETIDFIEAQKSLKGDTVHHDISNERLAPLRSVSFVQKYAELVAIRQNSLVKPTFPGPSMPPTLVIVSSPRS